MSDRELAIAVLLDARARVERNWHPHHADVGPNGQRTALAWINLVLAERGYPGDFWPPFMMEAERALISATLHRRAMDVLWRAAQTLRVAPKE